ncbi:hypothetical protein LINPERPRIM_LOCUS6053, partial [Linum perenne]
MNQRNGGVTMMCPSTWPTCVSHMLTWEASS